jgi:hypothetical protein
MPELNPVIETSTSGILPGVYRYTYVTNNLLKYTDPSGYVFRYRGVEQARWMESMSYYYNYMDLMNGYYHCSAEITMSTMPGAPKKTVS